MDRREANLSWEILMQAAQQGDEAAYRALLRGAASLARRHAVRRWGRVEAVEDLVQEVLLSVHQARHTYDPVRPFVPWLMAIIIYRMADAARRRARGEAHELPMDPTNETFSNFATNPPDGPLGDPELLRRAIADLPPGQRQALELLKLKEMTLKEASAASGQSVAALKVASHRAIKALRLILLGKPGR